MAWQHHQLQHHRSATASSLLKTTRTSFAPSMTVSELAQSQRLEGLYAASTLPGFQVPPGAKQQHPLESIFAPGPGAAPAFQKPPPLRTSQNSDDAAWGAARPGLQTSSQFSASADMAASLFEHERLVRLQRTMEELVYLQKDTNQHLAAISNAMKDTLASLQLPPAPPPARLLSRASSQLVNFARRSGRRDVVIDEDDLASEFDAFAVASAEELFAKARAKKRLKSGGM
jgi:hypothetical protein